MATREYYECGLFRATDKTQLPPELLSGFPSHLNERHVCDFLAGYLEETGAITAMYNMKEPIFLVVDDDEEMLEGIVKWSGIVPQDRQKSRYLKFTGYNALDLLGRIYTISPHGDKSKRLAVFQWLTMDRRFGPKNEEETYEFRYTLNHPEAKAPSKGRPTDSGYDLHLVEKIKTNEHGVEFYDTGVSVSPPFGYAFQLVGRSSITKSGYTIANNIGIIDRTYTGNIIVPLIKVNKEAPDLILPNRLVQIIPHKISHFVPVKVDSLNNTSRANKGFGSSNGEEAKGQ